MSGTMSHERKITMAGGEIVLSVRDYDGDVGTTSLRTGAVTAVSLPGLLTQIGAYRTAVEGLIIGEMAKESLTAFSTILSQDRPSDQFAQRDTKWLVHYHDNTQFFDAPLNAIPNAGYLKPFSVELPTANLALLDEGSTVLPALAISAYKAAAEAVGRSPYGGAIIIDYIEYAEN
jgi:hypothetical protein